MKNRNICISTYPGLTIIFEPKVKLEISKIRKSKLFFRVQEMVRW